MYSTLISAHDLAAHHSFVVVDCRHNLLDFDAGLHAYHDAHVPGALFLRMENDLSGPKTGANGRHPLPDPPMLAAKLGAIGIDASKQIVAYDQNSGVFAARLWWLARWLGHANVAVLDGGFDAWRAAGLETTSVAPSPTPTHFIIRPRLESAVQASTLQGDPSLVLIDARAADRFRGENETLDPIAGHIPGALNRPFAQNIGPDGRFKSAAQLRSEFHALLGNRDPTHVVHYCGSGITAAHNRLAMEVGGIAGSRLYPGSWSEWIADPTHPVAR